jgi:hypothetical protein
VRREEIERYAQPGESYEEAAARLRKKRETAGQGNTKVFTFPAGASVDNAARSAPRNDTRQIPIQGAIGVVVDNDNSLARKLAGVEQRWRNQRKSEQAGASAAGEAAGTNGARAGSEPTIITPGTAVQAPQQLDLMQEAGLLLPGWHSECRGVPNGILRSALFAAIRPTHERRRIKNETLASVDGLTIIYNGDQLDQGDLDVYEGELHFAMTHGIPLGQPVLHSDAAILKSLGRGTGRKEYLRLRDSQIRLVGGVVEIKYGHYSYTGTLIREIYRDEKLKMTGPIFNPKLVALFQDGSYSSVYWEHRLALSDSPLAQWLHGHYSSHKQPYEYTVAKLHELCGSETASLRKFRQNLIAALAKLAAVTGWRCEIIAGDKVRVDRTGGAAEVRLAAPRKSGRKSTPKDQGNVSE